MEYRVTRPMPYAGYSFGAKFSCATFRGFILRYKANFGLCAPRSAY